MFDPPNLDVKGIQEMMTRVAAAGQGKIAGSFLFLCLLISLFLWGGFSGFEARTLVAAGLGPRRGFFLFLFFF